MARGRMISKSLSTSEKRAALHQEAGKLAEFCQAIFPLLVAHADDWGCLSGDVFTVKHLVDPSSPRKLPEFTAALVALHNVGLIVWYDAATNDGAKQIIHIRGWFAHQQLKGHEKDGRSRAFPAPPEKISKLEDFAQSCPESPKSALTELNRTELKGTELNLTALRAVGDDAFTAFWFAYPKKKSRSDAERAWKKLAPSPELCQRIQGALSVQRMSADWAKDGGQFIPYPASWLNARRWEDEAGHPAAPVIGTRTAALSRATAGFLAEGGS